MMQSQLFAPAAPRMDLGVLTTPEIDVALGAHAAVGIGVSGGKDSCLLAFAVEAHLREIGHQGTRILVHADLGRIEWTDSLATCQRLADALDLELVTVRRQAGDMVDRWLVRWDNNVARYHDLSCVKLILPWSTPSMRFCTSELKTAVICAELARRFRGQAILSAVGIRRQESPKRRQAPISTRQALLHRPSFGTRGWTWNAVLHWLLDDVLAFLAARGFALHEAYRDWDSTRLSCMYCILGSLRDLTASTRAAERHPHHAEVYRLLVDLEIASAFSFQSDHWLGDVAPHLLTDEQRAGLLAAKRRAQLRDAAEARIPAHLLYVKGWPVAVPSLDDAALVGEVRAEVAALYGWQVPYIEPEAVRSRYAELIALRDGNNDCDDDPNP